MPRNGGISHIRAGLGVRKLAAGFRPTVSEDDILVSRFLERTASYLLVLWRAMPDCRAGDPVVGRAQAAEGTAHAGKARTYQPSSMWPPAERRSYSYS
jgi:hypothetical protein